MPFERNVFINCPFDRDYKVLLEPLLFSIIYLGYEPMISETESSFDIRVDNIAKLIADSKYSIHDLSRSKYRNKGDLPRFNMPFELGLDIGCKKYGISKQKQKKCLIVATQRYEYHKVISDISGSDIQAHGDDPARLIKAVRDWFSLLEGKTLAGPDKILNLYYDFSGKLAVSLQAKGFSIQNIEELTFSDFIIQAKKWVRGLSKVV